MTRKSKGRPGTSDQSLEVAQKTEGEPAAKKSLVTLNPPSPSAPEIVLQRPEEQCGGRSSGESTRACLHLDLNLDAGQGHEGRAVARKSPVTVQEWVDSLPHPQHHRNEEESEENPVEDIEDNLSLGAEAGHLYDGLGGVSGGSPQFLSTPLQTEGRADNRREVFAQAKSREQLASFQSDSAHSVASHTSRSSVESLLESRKANPEEVLFSLGFGGPMDEEVTRIPRRFLQPSKVRGVAVEDFIQHQKNEIETFESGFSGYRGLTGPSHKRPSVIVAKIIEKLREHDRDSSSVDSADPSQPPSSPVATPVIRNRFSTMAKRVMKRTSVLTKIKSADSRQMSVLTPDNRKFLDSQGNKSPDVPRKRMIIGQRSFTFSCDGDLIEVEQDEDGNDCKANSVTIAEESESSEKADPAPSFLARKPLIHKDSLLSSATSLTSYDSDSDTDEGSSDVKRHILTQETEFRGNDVHHFGRVLPPPPENTINISGNSNVKTNFASVVAAAGMFARKNQMCPAKTPISKRMSSTSLSSWESDGKSPVSIENSHWPIFPEFESIEEQMSEDASQSASDKNMSCQTATSEESKAECSNSNNVEGAAVSDDIFASQIDSDLVLEWVSSNLQLRRSSLKRQSNVQDEVQDGSAGKEEEEVETEEPTAGNPRNPVVAELRNRELAPKVDSFEMEEIITAEDDIPELCLPSDGSKDCGGLCRAGSAQSDSSGFMEGDNAEAVVMDDVSHARLKVPVVSFAGSDSSTSTIVFDRNLSEEIPTPEQQQTECEQNCCGSNGSESILPHADTKNIKEDSFAVCCQDGAIESECSRFVCETHQKIVDVGLKGASLIVAPSLNNNKRTSLPLEVQCRNSGGLKRYSLPVVCVESADGGVLCQRSNSFNSMCSGCESHVSDSVPCIFRKVRSVPDSLYTLEKSLSCPKESEQRPFSQRSQQEFCASNGNVFSSCSDESVINTGCVNVNSAKDDGSSAANCDNESRSGSDGNHRDAQNQSDSSNTPPSKEVSESLLRLPLLDSSYYMDQDVCDSGLSGETVIYVPCRNGDETEQTASTSKEESATEEEKEQSHVLYHQIKELATELTARGVRVALGSETEFACQSLEEQHRLRSESIELALQAYREDLERQQAMSRRLQQHVGDLMMPDTQKELEYVHEIRKCISVEVDRMASFLQEWKDRPVDVGKRVSDILTQMTCLLKQQTSLCQELERLSLRKVTDEGGEVPTFSDASIETENSVEDKACEVETASSALSSEHMQLADYIIREVQQLIRKENQKIETIVQRNTEELQQVKETMLKRFSEKD